MSVREPILFIEINNSEFIFIVCDLDENKNVELIHSIKIPLKGIIDKNNSDLRLVSNIIIKKMFFN